MSQENQNNQAGQTSGAAAGGQGAAQQGGAGETNQQAGQQGQQPAASAGTQTAPPAAGLSPDQIQALVKTAVGEVAQQHAPQEAPEVTMAKFEKAFNVHKFDREKMMQRLGYSEEQIDSVMPFFDELRDGLVRQAVTMSNYQISLMRDELTKMFQPALTAAQQQMETQLRAEFMEKHKDLTGYEPLLEEIKNRLVAEKRQFKSKEELFTTIATEAKTIIDKVLKTGGAAGNGSGNGSGTSQQQQQSSHRMSTVSAGGQGGAGAASTTSGDKPGWLKALE